MNRRGLLASIMAAALLIGAGLGAPGGPAAFAQQAPSATTPPATDTGLSPFDDRQVRTTILPGTPPTQPPPPLPVRVMPGGDISLNFPQVDVSAVAKAVLGDTLKLPFSIDPTIHGPVTVVTPHPIHRADVLPFFEQALTRANLVLANRGGTFAILPAGSARAEAPVVGPNDEGFGNETITLKFVNADEMRKLLDPLVPNAVAAASAPLNALIISGNATQRKALRDLVAEFDVDWLKGMSFALFVPQRTDARLIAPELEKLINAPGAQSAGMVRLIAMDQLNGILAITGQRQYLDDVRRFVEVLDREGESAERRVFVYHVQNGRAADLTKVLNAAFGNGSAAADTGPTDPDAPSLTDTTSHERTTPTQAGLPGGLIGGATTRSGFPAAPAASTSGASGERGGASGTTITDDETNNAIVVFSTPRDFALITDALAKLDVPPLQVMIDASISEVTLNHTLQYGLQWAFEAGPLSGALSQGQVTQETVQTGGTTTTLPNGTTITTPINSVTRNINPGPIQNFPGMSFLYRGHGWSAVLNALHTITDVTVLSAPKLTVLNNHTATIEVGDQVPISTGSAVSTLTAGAPIVNSVEYRDTGIILKITPRVNSGGLVLLDIAQEVSEVNTSATSSSQIASPTISERKIATSVAVQDGETVALGGLIKNEVQKGRSSIPLLDEIPVLGHLFGDTTGGLIRTELVVLLTPRVIRTPVDARAVTKELRERIHEAAPPPPPSADKPSKKGKPATPAG